MRRNVRTRIGSILLAALMLLSLLPVSALAAEDSNVTAITKTVTADLQASHYDDEGEKWTATEGLTQNEDGTYTFKDTAGDVYESVGSLNFTAADEKWEGDTTVETEVYINPADFVTGEGFTMVCDIMPTWRAYVVGIRKLDSGAMLVDFSNNSSYAVTENESNYQKKIENAGWYTFRWELFEQDGKVACNLFMEDEQVGVTRTNAADSVESSYFRKFWIPTYGPKPIGGGKTEDLEIYSGKSLQFKDVTKTVVTGYEWSVSTAAELKDALAEAQDGDTIKLAASFETADTIAVSQKAVTIDLNDKTLTYTGATEKKMPAVQVENSGKVTVKNGSVVANTVAEGFHAMFAKQNGELVLDGVTLETTGNGVVITSNNAKASVINGSVITAKSWPVATYQNGVDQEIKIENSTINATEDGYGTAVLVNQSGTTLTVTSSTVNGYGHGIVVRNGAANITDTTITNTVNDEDDINNAWGGGDGVPTGALVIGEGRSDATVPAINVDLTGVTVESLGNQAKKVDAIYVQEKGDSTANDLLNVGTGCTINGKVTVSTEDGQTATSEDGTIPTSPSLIKEVSTVAQLKDEIDSAKDGTTIILAPGTYKLNEISGFTNTGISINKPVKIVGADKATTFIEIAGSAGVEQKAFTLGAGSGGTEFKNLTFKMDLKNRDSAAIYFNDNFDNADAETPVKITNVDFIGADTLGTIGQDTAILSASPDGGYVEISGCSFKNLKWGMYFNRMNHLVIENNVIDGTRYSAIIIAADNENRECEDIVIKNNKLTNISTEPNYNVEAYNSGISFGKKATGIVLENNSIQMQNERKAVYFAPAEDVTRIMVTFMNDGVEYGRQILEEAGEITLPKLNKDNYTFNGWLNSADNKVYTGTIAITADTTFTAQWTADSTGGGTPTEPTEAEPFTDVDENDWFYDEVVYVYENGLMQGTSDTAFSPKNEMDRAMLVTTLYRMEGKPSVADVDVPFTDVTEGYYVDAVAWAYANDIVSGYEDNTFQPKKAITREQYVTILHRYAQFKGMDVSSDADLSAFTDADKVSGWAEEAMIWAVDTELMQGVTETTIAPRKTAQRCQGAALLTRFHQMMA